jgi:phenylacetic acid degradation operon negative regulatory protein
MQISNAPLTARSVLASTLLGSDPPELPVANLVRVTGLFGINENRTRVALSRMVAAGEASTDGDGRYRLSGHLLERQSRQVASRTGHQGSWSGGWHLVVTASGRAAEVRGHRRRSLSLARLGEWREGFWLRPDNLELHLPGIVAGDVTVFSGHPVSDPAKMAAALWDLDQWATRADALLSALAQLVPHDPTDLAPGFVLSASVLRHFQSDPLLPEELLPAKWPGGQLRRHYEDWDRRYRRLLARWVSAPSPTGADS